MKTPTDKQIAFVERICQQLHLDFPMSSKEFNRRCFSDFISNHIDEFKRACADINEDVDFVYECVGCENDVWCEYY